MAETKINVGYGVGIFNLLGVLFVGLKLGGVISWSWWWVTLPFWGAFILGVIALACVFIFVGILQWLNR